MDKQEIFKYYHLESDAVRADWVVERCIGPSHTLHSIIPSGFESYARILHPAWSTGSLDADDKKAWSELNAGWREAENFTPIRWDTTAAENDHVAHRLMRWPDICSPTPREPGKEGVDPPFDGELTQKMVKTLFEIFIGYSDENQEVLCGFWEGNSFLNSSRPLASFASYHHVYYPLNTTLAGARDSWLAAIEYSSRNHGRGTNGLAPHVVWPTSQEWYLVVHYGLTSSYVGGPTNLIDSIRSAGDLETYEALRGDKLY